MKGVDLPPDDEDFTADPVELFFDLTFVFAFSRLVYHLVHHPDWTGVAEFALLVVMIWLPWTQFTWSANAVAGNARPVRLLFLVGTVASVPMAASVTTAFGDGGATFAIPLGIILSLGLATMIAGLPPGHEVRASILRYSIPNLVGIVVMIAGSFLGREPRIAAWVVAMAIVIAGTQLAGGDSWLVRPGHFAERHGLIVIVALGEVIVAMGAPLAGRLEGGDGLAAETLVAMIAAGVFACLMWWAYFDRVNRALEHRHAQVGSGQASGRYARDVYTYWHLPVVAGVILLAAALEEIALHPKDVLDPAFRWMLVSGMALFSGGIALTVWRAFRVVAKERVAAALLLAAVVALAGSVDGVLLLLLVDGALLVALVVEHVRIEGAPRRSAPQDAARPTVDS
jgi:low temperature requirement protein LtrA